MAKEQFMLELDRKMLPKVLTRYVYRSRDVDSSSPIVDGFYVQRSMFSEQPPEEITLTIEWASPEK